MNRENDWWEYLAHGQAGAARANHKYFARVPLGEFRRKDAVPVFLLPGENKLAKINACEKIQKAVR